MAAPKTKKAKATRASPDTKQSKATTKTTVKHTRNNASPAPSPLLELAPELRNTIFRYAIISNEPIKVSFRAIRGTNRRRFTMVPGLIHACVQTRLETQRLFIEENEFEISPEILKLSCAARPLTLFRSMHYRVGFNLRSVRVCQEIKKRVQGDLFQLKANFTVRKYRPGLGLVISDQVYSATFLGKTPSGRAAPSINVCGCDVITFGLQYVEVTKGNDLVHFLAELYKRVPHRMPSYNAADMSRTDEVVYSVQSYDFCRRCLSRGLRSVEF